MNESEQAQAIERYIIDPTGVIEQPIESPNGEFVLYADHKTIVDSQAQKIAELESLLESSRSLCSIACDRFEQAKQEAEKYRNAYVETAAPIYGHHPKSLMQASLLPWEDGRIKP